MEHCIHSLDSPLAILSPQVSRHGSRTERGRKPERSHSNWRETRQRVTGIFDSPTIPSASCSGVQDKTRKQGRYTVCIPLAASHAQVGTFLRDDYHGGTAILRTRAYPPLLPSPSVVFRHRG